METKLEEVKTWMATNRLQMNDSKTELIFFGTKKQTESCLDTKLSIGNEIIRPVTMVKHLGAWLDSALNMKKFITEKCKIANYNLYKIRKLQNVQRILCITMRLLNTPPLVHRYTE